MKVVIMGSGSMGSLFGGFLAKSGVDVTLIDKKTITDTIRKKGLEITGVSSHYHIKVKATHNPSEVGAADLVMIIVKAYDTEQAVKDAIPLIGKNTWVMCLQNGLGNEEIASRIIGRERILRGITTNGAMLEKPGKVIHTGTGETTIGRCYGPNTNEVDKIAQMITESGLPSNVTPNISGIVWGKALVNAGINPFGTLTGMRNGELLEVPEIVESIKELVLEGAEVAHKLGVHLPFNPVEKTFEVARQTAQNKNSMLQDIERGKRTEIDYINGAISRYGREVHVPTPMNDLVTALVKGLEKRTTKSGCG
ncbi:MAG: ketopantoate reductase family protein [Candidatus Freyarchaeota archaeon]